MEVYYFIEQKGNKNGPFKLSEIKEQTIYSDTLIWRSDNDQWKRASEYEELKNNFIVKPPLTDKERKINSVRKRFLEETIRTLVLFYVGASLILGFISYSIAQSSWEQYLHENYTGSYSPGVITLKERQDNDRYPYYNPDINNEEYAAMNQDFLFRPFKAFSSTIYLTAAERDDPGVLLCHLLLSSFASLLIFFIGVGFIIYFLQVNQ